MGGSSLADPISAAWADIYPDPNPSPPPADGWSPASPGRVYSIGRWTVAFDAVSGAISSLVDSITKQTWAIPADGSFLGLVQYDTFDNASIAEYLEVRSPAMRMQTEMQTYFQTHVRFLLVAMAGVCFGSCIASQFR